ncbi:uncharacterized protein LOC107307709 [Coturnix japonica]|uniref:uncharacterized protein LOC107307709 n=1 Tax=Coturnix japonica TaxID=93934 RepID=UPI000777D5E2|nr:uncharacterized protein LOC107307709 [Coturnix japonica]
MGQLRETTAPRCCFLLLLLLFLVTPCHGQPQNVAWEALSPDDRVDDIQESYPIEGDQERLQDSRDLPAHHISGMYRFHQPQGYPRAVAPQIPNPRSQMVLGFGPEEYSRVAGGVRTTMRVEQKRGEYNSAFAVLAILFCLVILAALAFLAKRLLMKRQEDAMPFEAVRKNEDPDPANEGQTIVRFMIEIEDLSGDSMSNLKGLHSAISQINDIFSQSPQRSAKQSGIAERSKKAQKSRKEEKNTS